MAKDIIRVVESQRGHFDPGGYAKDFGIGAAVSAPFGLIGSVAGPAGAAAGAASAGLLGGLANAGFKGVEDAWYLLSSKNKKIAWLAGDLEDTLANELAPVIADIDPNIAKEIKNYAASYKEYIDHYIRDEKTEAMKDNVVANDSSAVTQEPAQNAEQSEGQQIADQFLKNTSMLRLEKNHTKFVRVAQVSALVQVPLEMGGMIGLDAATNAIGKAWRGDKQLDYAIDKSNKILQEIDEVSKDLTPNLLGYIRSGGQIIYKLLDAVKQIASSKTDAVTPPVQNPPAINQEVNP